MTRKWSFSTSQTLLLVFSNRSWSCTPPPMAHSLDPTLSGLIEISISHKINTEILACDKKIVSCLHLNRVNRIMKSGAVVRSSRKKKPVSNSWTVVRDTRWLYRKTVNCEFHRKWMPFEQVYRRIISGSAFPCVQPLACDSGGWLGGARMKSHGAAVCRRL